MAGAGSINIMIHMYPAHDISLLIVSKQVN